MRKLGIFVVVVGWVAGIAACGTKHETARTDDFTKIDSLTETYLSLQDTMLESWNIMLKDENLKIRSMHALLHHLLSTPGFDQSQLISLEQRLEQLDRIRFTQKSMCDPHVVEEYDFASNSLISEILTLAESDPGFANDSQLQDLTDEIKSADQRVNIYREEYDSATRQFNTFLEEYKDYLKDIDETATAQKRPLFEMAGR
jgi:hypothetical protein